jgi:hypothetical protein
LETTRPTPRTMRPIITMYFSLDISHLLAEERGKTPLSPRAGHPLPSH